MLHDYLGELVADFIACAPEQKANMRMPSETTVTELYRWSLEQTKEPDLPYGTNQQRKKETTTA